MRILFVSRSKNGRPSSLISNQASSLCKYGLEIDNFLIEGQGVFGYIHSVIKLHIFLTDKKYEIIHAHYGLCGLVAYFAKIDQKIIVSFMGDDLLGSIKEGRYTRSSRLVSLVNSYLANKCYDHIIVKSYGMYQKLSNPLKCSIIPNGVNLSIFYPIDRNIARAKLGFPESTNIILFASSPSRPEKNYRLAEESFNLLDLPDSMLVHVSNQPQEILNLFYNASDCLLLTSFHEGSPNVIKEALAVNLPIVSTNVGDVSVNLETVENCYICEFNSQDCAKKLQLALSMGKRTKGRARLVELGLDAESTADQIHYLYNKVIET